CARQALHSFPTRRSSDLERRRIGEELQRRLPPPRYRWADRRSRAPDPPRDWPLWKATVPERLAAASFMGAFFLVTGADVGSSARSEEHTSELQSLAYLVC